MKTQEGKKSILEILSSEIFTGLFALLTLIMMFAFNGTPLVPSIFSWITFVLFFIRYKMQNCGFWLPAIWAFNATLWTINFAIS